jgi:hypothetical protein
LISWIPEESNADIGSLPVDINSHSKDQLTALKTGCLGMIAMSTRSQLFKNSVARAFAAGDVSFMTNDFFSPIVQELLQLASTGHKGISSIDTLTSGNVVDSVNAALNAVFTVLPLHSVANIVETFLKTEKNVKVTTSMMFLASQRLAHDVGSDFTLKPALALLLGLLNDLVKSVDDTDATVVALSSIGKLSRAHGKAELPFFEAIVPTIVEHGVKSDSLVVKENSVDCLCAMMYFRFGNC